MSTSLNPKRDTGDIVGVADDTTTVVPVDSPARLAYLLGSLRLTLRLTGRPRDPAVARWVDTLIASVGALLPQEVLDQVDRRIESLTQRTDHAA